MTDLKTLKKSATAAAKAAKAAAEDSTAQAVSVAGQIDELKMRHLGLIIEANKQNSRAEAAAILARLADSDLIPAVIGEREPAEAEVASLVKRGLMWRAKGYTWRGPAQGWLPARPIVVALYRELTAAANTEDR